MTADGAARASDLVVHEDIVSPFCAVPATMSGLLSRTTKSWQPKEVARLPARDFCRPQSLTHQRRSSKGNQRRLKRRCYVRASCSGRPARAFDLWA